MIKKPLDVLTNHEIRKTKKQKTAFIHAVDEYANELGYDVKIEKGSFGVRNVVIGNPEKAKYLVTAHYDTPASIGLPNFITPCNPWAFILCQLLLLIPFFLIAFISARLVSLVTNNAVTIIYVADLVLLGMLFLLMFGPANRHTANDNTSGVVTVLQIMATLPENMKSRVCFVLFDLEEAGLIGSSSYRKAHKEETNHQTVLNLDCVGDGNSIVLFPMKRMKEDQLRMDRLRGIMGTYGSKTITVHETGFAYYPSDQKHFPYGVGIAAFRRARGIGLYCGRIHTWRDTILEETNVNTLCAALISLISAGEE